MKLLIEESPLIVLPSLAKMVGVDKSILLQQLHFRLTTAGEIREGITWYCQSASNWALQLPFFSEHKIKRLFQELEKAGIVQSTDRFNVFFVDRTKWYRIDYEKLEQLLYEHQKQNCSEEEHGQSLPESTDAPSEQHTDTRSINLKNKDFKDVGLTQTVNDILNYLNEKANKRFKLTTVSNRAPIIARLKEGYTVEECKQVIDIMTARWLHNKKMNQYLRPQTLFRASNIDTYLQAPAVPFEKLPAYREATEVQLDFEEGEQ